MSDTINPEGKQPNRGEKGKMASNVDGSPIEGVFDYGIIIFVILYFLGVPKDFLL